MNTAIELGRDGTRTIFHRRGGMAWTHPEGERYRYWTRTQRESRWVWDWVEVPCDCPSEASSKASQAA